MPNESSIPEIPDFLKRKPDPELSPITSGPPPGAIADPIQKVPEPHLPPAPGPEAFMPGASRKTSTILAQFEAVARSIEETDSTLRAEIEAFIQRLQHQLEESTSASTDAASAYRAEGLRLQTEADSYLEALKAVAENSRAQAKRVRELKGETS